ncbi:hypothetical protein [Ancylobacter oerskovii]|nr:hypothetical protein [Ancylobacter oerskovii]MBS7544641.1 hypothetical protein [Ancylobacter oerskovii]
MIVPDLAPPNRLRVPSLGGDTYAPPARPVINNDLDRMASSLGNFSQTLASYGRKQQAEREEQERNSAQAKAQAFIAAHGRKELYDAVNAGTAPYANHPVYGAIYEKRIAEDTADEFRGELNRRIADGELDLASTDVERYLIEAGADYAKRLPSGSAVAMTAWGRGMESIRGSLLESQQKLRAQQTHEFRIEEAQRDLDKIITGNLSAGLDPETTAARLRDAYSFLGRGEKGALRLSNPEIDQLIMGRLKDQVRQYPEQVLGILHADRHDARTGASIGPLAKNPKFLSDAQLIEDTARRTLAAREKATVEQETARADFEALRTGDPSFWSISDKSYRNTFSGETATLSGESRRQAAVNEYFTYSDRVASEQRESPDATMERDYAVLVERLGLPHPRWKQTLEGAVQTIGNDVSLTDPAKARTLGAAARFWETLSNRNPAYADGLVDRDTADFFRVYQASRNSLGRTEDQALRDAAATRRPLNADEEASLQGQGQAIETAVSGTNGFSLWKPSTWLGSSVRNEGTMKRQIVETAKLYARIQGVSPKKAVELASRDVESRTVLINGQALFGDPHVTPSTKPLFEMALQDSYEQHRDSLRSLGYDGSGDLSIRPVGGSGGLYEVISAEDGAPVSVPVRGEDGRLGYRSLMIRARDLDAFREQQRGEVLGKVVRDWKPASQTPPGIGDRLRRPNPSNSPEMPERAPARR